MWCGVMWCAVVYTVMYTVVCCAVWCALYAVLCAFDFMSRLCVCCFLSTDSVNGLQVLSLLLDAPSIDVNARDNSGVSALHHLAFQVRFHSQSCASLILVNRCVCMCVWSMCVFCVWCVVFCECVHVCVSLHASRCDRVMQTWWSG